MFFTGILSGLSKTESKISPKEDKEIKMSFVKNYVCVDLETTGLNPKKDRIIEIGAVRVRDGKVTDTFQQLICPRQQIEERVEKLTGITQQDLEGKPSIQEILPQIGEFLGEDILLGHSILFDYSFLKRTFTNEKIPFERQGIDTLKIARKYVTDCSSKKLESLCQHYGITHQAHRALGDALATVELYQKLAEQYFEEESFSPIPLQFKVKKESPITKAQKERLTLLLAKHNIELAVEIGSLTRNEASRYIDNILSEYGK